MHNDRALVRRIAVLGVALFVFIIAVTVYTTRSNNFAPVSRSNLTSRPAIINAQPLQDTMPAGAYAYTVARIYDYLATSNVSAATLTLSGSVSTNPSTYSFNLDISPPLSVAQRLAVTVQVTNFSSVISTAVLINGILQNPNVTQGSINFSGLGGLTSAGLTTFQANSLQMAFQKFAPQASTARIDPTSITQPPADPANASSPLIYTFDVTVDGTAYKATVTCPTLSSVQLVLKNSAGKQIFDSGVISSN